MEPEKIAYTPYGDIMPAHDFIVDISLYGGPYTELEKLGCEVQEIVGNKILVVYPANATRQLLYPVTRCERYRVILPDSTELREKKCRGINYLYLIIKDEEQPKGEVEQ